MLAPGQLSILKEMGILVWEQRTVENLTPASEPADTEFYAPLPAVDCLIAVAEHDMDDDAMRLLHAMLFSIGLTANNSAIVSSQQLSQSDILANDHKVLLALGDDLVPKKLTSQTLERGHVYTAADSTLKIITSHSLMTLLKSPAKKALAWHDLQLAKMTLQQENNA